MAAAIFAILAFFALDDMASDPWKFMVPVNICLCFFLTGMASMSGAKTFFKALFGDKNTFAGVIYLIGLACAIYFSAVEPDYLYTLFFSVLQINAVMFFFLHMNPINPESIKQNFKAIV